MIRHSIFVMAMMAGSASAQGFSGATLGIEYTNFLDEANLGGVNYYVQGEAALGAGFSVALDLTAYDFALAGSDGTNITGHAIYSLSDQIALGAFYGQDRSDGATIDNYGIEAAFGANALNAQAYLGQADRSAGDAGYFGASAAYAITNDIVATGAFDRVNSDAFDATTLELGGKYAFANGPVVSASVGQLSRAVTAGADTNETFLAIKARIDVGGFGGTTFDRRGYFDALNFNGQ